MNTTSSEYTLDAIRSNCAILLEYALFDTKLRFTFFSNDENMVSFVSPKSNEYGVPFGITFYKEGTHDAILFAQAIAMKTEQGQDIGILNIPIDFNAGDTAPYVKKKILEYLAQYTKLTIYTLVKVRIGDLKNNLPIQMVIQATEEEILSLIKSSVSSSGFSLFGYVNYSKEKGPTIPRIISFSNKEPFVIDVMGPVDERWENPNLNF